MAISPIDDKDVSDPLSAGTEGGWVAEDLELRRHTVGGETPPRNLLPTAQQAQQVQRNPSDASAVSATSTIRRYSAGYFQVRRKPIAPRPVSPVSEGGHDDGSRNGDVGEEESSVRDAGRDSEGPFLVPLGRSEHMGRVGNSGARRSTSQAQIARNYSYPGGSIPQRVSGDAEPSSGQRTTVLSKTQIGLLPERRQKHKERGHWLDARDGWRPSYLRRSVVLGFVAVFVSFLVIVESLLSVDLARGGLRIGKGAGPALWALVPPSVLIALASFWERVDFQARRYYPWLLLSKKWPNPSPPRPASETLLLDYASTSTIQALFTSIRNRHYLVAASTVTSILLVVSVILSAGLFVKEEERLHMSPLAAHALTALFSAMTVLVLLMVAQVPRHKIAPRNPNSIAGTAMSLAASPELVASLKGTGTGGIDTVSRRLSTSLFTAAIRSLRGETRPRYVLHSVSSENSMTTKFPEGGEEKSQAAYYEPFVLRLVPRVISILSAIFFASLLWGLLSVTARTGSLVDFSDRDVRYRAILWTSFPAMFLVSLSLYLARVDLELRTLTPSSELFYRPSPYLGAMTTTYTDEITVITLFKAWKKRRWSIFTTALAALFGSLTPILASSLFCVETLPQTSGGQSTGTQLVQNSPQTYALASLLVAMVLLSCASLIITPSRTTKTRRPPQTIGAVASLLSEGNLHTFFPPGAGVEWMKDEETARIFEGKAFRIGRFARMEPGEAGNCFCLSVVEDRSSTHC